jgi:hypothetical protein
MSEAIKTDSPDRTEAGDETPAHLPYTLPIELTVHDAVTIAELCTYPDGDERDQFALHALRIGVMALKQARGQLDAELVRRESERWLASLESRLDAHALTLNERLSGALKEYFDPGDGRFPERVDRLIGQDGDLEQLLRRHIGKDDSELAKTLITHVGADSPLMKVLSPDQSKGLLAALRETVEEQLDQQRTHVIGQFSLDNKDGALSRFIAQLTERQGELSETLHNRIDDVVKEFSLDDENSALSRLVRNVDRAQRTITSEFSLDDDSSSLARLKRELAKLLEDDRETNRKFQEEVKIALATMAARKQEAERSTRHGDVFEDAVFEFVQFESQKTGDIATNTSNQVGLIKNRKFGDVLVELGPESAAPDAKIAIEAKEEKKYSLNEAREEIEQARKNRRAQVGLFVFSKKIAPEGLDEFARYGNDVVVVWDAEDAHSDLFLRTGLTLARALCVRAGKQGADEAAAFLTIENAILEVEKQAGMLAKIETWAQTIRNNSDEILERMRKSRKSLTKQVSLLSETTIALKATLAGPDVDTE